MKNKYDFRSSSDILVIGALYLEYGDKAWTMLNGMFSIVLFDEKKEKFFIVRDHIGIIPLYYGKNDEGVVYVSSELKAIEKYC